jgi:hypothetical protein
VIDVPVFVANGDSDTMIMPRYSYLLADLIPPRPGEDLPRFGARILVPAPRPIAADVQHYLTGAR